MLDRQCGELIALTEEERIGGSAPAWTWSKVARAASNIKCIRTASERLEGRCDVLGAPPPQFV